jgi:hypothetical protein
MDDRHAGHEHAEDGEKHATTRRNFLRRAGITGAAAAALIGGADLAGLTPAYARSQKARAGARGKTACAGCSYGCTYTPGKCGGCGTGGCCFTCTGSCGTLRQCHPCSDRPAYNLCIDSGSTGRRGRTSGGQDTDCLCPYQCSYTPGKCGSCGTGNCCFSCTSPCGNFKQCNNCDKRPSYAGCE